jgi:hypothetical protein
MRLKGVRFSRGQPWAALAHNSDQLRARRLRVTRALTELHAAELVDIRPEGQRDRFEYFSLRKEDGSTEPYRLPGEGAEDVLHLPPAFFYYGWHLVLEPTEIAVYLAILEMTDAVMSTAVGNKRADEVGVALPESLRWGRYGLSGEVYESIHELAEFELIQIYDPMPNRRRGKYRPATVEERAMGQASGLALSPVPYQFVVNQISGLDPFRVITESLETWDLPPRLLSSTSLYTADDPLAR